MTGPYPRDRCYASVLAIVLICLVGQGLGARGVGAQALFGPSSLYLGQKGPITPLPPPLVGSPLPVHG